MNYYLLIHELVIIPAQIGLFVNRSVRGFFRPVPFKAAVTHLLSHVLYIPRNIMHLKKMFDHNIVRTTSTTMFLIWPYYYRRKITVVSIYYPGELWVDQYWWA